MAPATTAQLHLASKPRPTRREIGAGQRGFVQRLLRRHGCKTRWGAGPGLVLRKQRRLPLQVNLSFEMRCARVWLAQLAAELRWPPQFVERRQQHAHFSQFAATLLVWRPGERSLSNWHKTSKELRQKLIREPIVSLHLRSELRLATERIRELRSELRLATERIREPVPSPRPVSRFEASVRTHHVREAERVLDLPGITAGRTSRVREITASIGQNSRLEAKHASVRSLREGRMPQVHSMRSSLTAGLRRIEFHAAHSHRSIVLTAQRREHRQSRLERMLSHYLTESTVMAAPTKAAASTGRTGSEMRLRRPERTWEQSHPHAFAPDMTLYRPQRNGDGQRQISAALPEVITAVKAAGSAATPAQPVGLAEPDLSQLTERVYAELERKMRNERIRRGL